MAQVHLQYNNNINMTSLVTVSCTLIVKGKFCYYLCFFSL